MSVLLFRLLFSSSSLQVQLNNNLCKIRAEGRSSSSTWKCLWPEWIHKAHRQQNKTLRSFIHSPILSCPSCCCYHHAQQCVLDAWVPPSSTWPSRKPWRTGCWQEWGWKPRAKDPTTQWRGTHREHRSRVGWRTFASGVAGKSSTSPPCKSRSERRRRSPLARFPVCASQRLTQALPNGIPSSQSTMAPSSPQRAQSVELDPRSLLNLQQRMSPTAS